MVMLHFVCFLPRDAMLVRYLLWPCVCLSKVGVLLKQLNIGPCKQHHMIAQDSSFLVPKILAKFHQGQVGWVKIDDFRQITGNISKMVQDRRIVSVKV